MLGSPLRIPTQSRRRDEYYNAGSPKERAQKGKTQKKRLINLARNMTEIELVTESTSVDLMVQIKCEEEKKRKGRKKEERKKKIPGSPPPPTERKSIRTTFGPGSPTGTPLEGAQTTTPDCLTSKLFSGTFLHFQTFHPNTNTQHTNPASNQPAFRLPLKSLPASRDSRMAASMG